MFKKLFGMGDKTAPRELVSVDQLEKRDIITFKHRQILPPEIQGHTFEVTGVGSYQYDDGTVKELTLSNEDQQNYFITLDKNDGEPYIAISRKIPRAQVLTLFDENDFAQLWEEGYCHLTTQTVPEGLEAWVTDSYQQEINQGEAYYYDRDMLKTKPSAYADDDGEPLRYHDCEGSDDSYGLSVEVWTDGTTDVAVVVYCPVDVIEEFHPHD